jgi:hypothetical protein
MSGTTSVPSPTFAETGFVSPLESAVLAGRIADVDAALGGGFNMEPETPQGQLSSSDAAIIADCYDQFCYLSSMMDPKYNMGRWQDGIARIYFLTRKPAQATVVVATCSGATGVIIPVGALAEASDNNLFICTIGGTIGGGGTVDCTFECISTGAIACGVGSLNRIYQTLPNWDSIYNSSDGILGSEVESRAAFEIRRAQSVAVNAIGTLPSIRAAVLQVPGVLDCYVLDNPTAASVTTGGVTIPAYSIYTCVAGGDSLAVATAIWTKKPPGSPYAGTNTVTVTDDNSDYNLPYPTYTVKFTPATPTAIKFLVTVTNNATVPVDAPAKIQAAIIAAFAGADGGPRAQIGGTIYASRFYSAVAALGPWTAYIVSIRIGVADPAASDTVTLNLNLVPTVAASDITVTLV